MNAAAHRQAMDLLRELLERRWVTTPLDASAYSFAYFSGPIPYLCYAEINPDMEGLLFRAQLGGAPLEQENYSAMALLCETLNVNFPIGCFSFNAENGQVRWKHGVHFWNERVTEHLIRNIVEPSLLHIDDATPALVSVHTGRPLEEALARIGEDLGIGTNEHCHYRLEPHPRLRAA